MPLIRLVILILEVFIFIVFGWALVKWFVQANEIKRWELRYTKIGASIFMVTHLTVAAFYPLPSLFMSILGIFILCNSLALFFWCYIIFRNQAPAVAFSQTITTGLKTTGPYKIVRNPIYTSYSLTWLGGTIATGCWWLLLSLVFMGIIYYKAATEEEKFWLAGKDKDRFAEYLKNTGMFFPKLF